MKPWESLTQLEQYECIYSDMHKSAFNCRPRNDTSSWTAKMFEAEFELLADVIQANSVEREREEKISVDNFKNSILKLISIGAENERAALLQMVGNEELHYPQDVEHWVWKQGILYTEYGEKIVEELCEMLFEKEGE